MAKRSIDSNDGRGGGGLVVLEGRSSRESKSACGEVGGVKKMSSTGSKLMVRGEECLEGCVGAGGGEVNRGGDDFEALGSMRPRPSLRRLKGSILRGLVRISTMLSLEETFLIKMFPFWTLSRRK
ncbi:hypothetical protein Tco_0860144 [Tanacetum coccineum]|uniref:Uncharacterized protein n=1 Tax=Tanacetum coccineum TaxID=301880 RepID=A0ABQ5BH40_9ASTR